jgi:SAM-dependent methyltransferase
MARPASARVSAQLIKKFNDLEMVIVGQSEFEPLIKSELANFPADLTSRIASQLSKGPVLEFDGKADVIMIRHLLHHFPEQAAVRMLSNLVTKLKPNGVILIVDLVMPKPGTTNSYDEALLRTRDLIHTELSNGETRDLESWDALISKVRGGLEISEIKRPVGSDLSFIKVQVAQQNGVGGH